MMAKSKAQDQVICVLGCGGFIGSHLVERFLEEDRYEEIIGVDLYSDKITHLLDDTRFSFVQADAHRYDLLESCIKDASTVISLVALCNPALYTTITLKVIDVNFTLPLEVVKLCQKMGRRLIHFSTSEVYGKTLSAFNPPNNENPDKYLLKEDETPLILGPISAQRWSYACAKQLLERAIYAYGYFEGLEYSIIRPYNFIGPRMDFLPEVHGEGIPRVFACFMDALLFNKPLQLVDGGQNRRCFTYIGDAVDAVIAMLDNRKQARNQIFNIGNPANEITISDFAQLMIRTYAKICGRDAVKSEIVNVSGEEFYGEGYEDSDRRVPDITRARELLKWNPEISLSEAVELSMRDFIYKYGQCSV